MKRLENKIAVVTASTRGIGQAIATRFAREGAAVYLAVRNLEAGEALAQAIIAEGGQAKAVHYDGADLNSVAPMFEAVYQDAGRLDILVNNLGGGNYPGNVDVANCTLEDIHRALDFNLVSTTLCCQQAIKMMHQNGGGSIINISSETSVSPQLNRSFYAISKTAINALTQHIALQYGRYNVRCNAILPPFTKTDAVKALDPRFEEEYSRSVPLGRVALPEDLANAALFLASDEASFITGELLLVNGGYTLTNSKYSQDILSFHPLAD